MSARIRSKIAGTASVGAIGTSIFLAGICPPLGLAALIGSIGTAIWSRQQLKPQLDEEAAVEQHLIRQISKENKEIVSQWRIARNPAERFLRIDRVIKEEGLFGIPIRRLKSSQTFEV